MVTGRSVCSERAVAINFESWLGKASSQSDPKLVLKRLWTSRGPF